MTHNDLLVILNNKDNEKAEIAARLKEIADLDDPAMMRNLIEYLLMMYFNYSKAA